jgi:hypothetical protein
LKHWKHVLDLRTEWSENDESLKKGYGKALSMVCGLGNNVALMIPLLFSDFVEVVMWKRLGGIYCYESMTRQRPHRPNVEFISPYLTVIVADGNPQCLLVGVYVWLLAVPVRVQASLSIALPRL